MNSRIVIGLLVLVGLVGAAAYTETKPAPELAKPKAQPSPAPDPDCPDGKCPPKGPKPRPKPWGEFVGAAVGGPTHADGTELQCDLPGSFHQKNTGGSDGAGLCVFASMRHSGLWADEPVFTDLFNWMKRHPGGGYPQKVDQMIARYCKETGKPKPAYLQVESSDLEVLKQACAAGLMPGVTYGKSPTGRYGGQRISHMVSLVHADDKHFVVLDNNYPGADAYEWLSPDEFKKAYGATSGKGWAVIPLKPGPPPVPHNSPPQERVMHLPTLALTLALLPAQAAVPDIPGEYEWKPWPGNTEAALMRGGKQIGSWNALKGWYRPVNEDGTWGPKQAPPVTPPAFDGGVDLSKLSDREVYKIGGKEVSKAVAEKAVEDAKIPDLKDKVRLTVIGSKAETDAVLADLKTSPALTPFTPDLVVAAYEPTHWHVAQAGYKVDGHPTIYLQDADGKVIHRQDDYADGAAGLAVAMDTARLRRARSDYDAKKDKDTRNPLAAAGLPGMWLVLAALGGGAYLYNRRKKG